MADAFFDLLEQTLASGVAPTSRRGDDRPSHPVTEQMRQQMAADREEEQRQAAIIRACFSTPDGRACLKLLIAKTIARPLTDMELSPPSLDAFALLKARRDGASQLIHMIHAALADAPLSDGV